MSSYRVDQIRILYDTLLKIHRTTDDTVGIKQLGEKLSLFERNTPFNKKIDSTYLETNFRKGILKAIKDKRTEIGFNNDYVDKIARFAGFLSYASFQEILKEVERKILTSINKDGDTDMKLIASENSLFNAFVEQITPYSLSIEKVVVEDLSAAFKIEKSSSKFTLVLLTENENNSRFKHDVVNHQNDVFPIKSNDEIQLNWPDLQQWMKCSSKLQYILFPMFFHYLMRIQTNTESEVTTSGTTMTVNGGIGNQGGTVNVQGKYVINGSTTLNISELKD